MLQSDSMTSSTPVLLPQLGLEVTEGRVNTVLVEVGARVRRDQALVELETDKAVTDVVAPADGVVVSIEVAEGDTVPVGAVLLQLATGDEPVQAAPKRRSGGARAAGAGVQMPVQAPAASVAGGNGAAASPPPANAASAADSPARIRVAPVARRAAAKLGVDLADDHRHRPARADHALRRRGRGGDAPRRRRPRSRRRRRPPGAHRHAARDRAAHDGQPADPAVPPGPRRRRHARAGRRRTRRVARGRQGGRQRPADPGDRGDRRPPPAARHRLRRRRPAAPAAQRVDRRRARRRHGPRARRAGDPRGARAGARRHRRGTASAWSPPRAPGGSRSTR